MRVIRIDAPPVSILCGAGGFRFDAEPVASGIAAIELRLATEPDGAIWLHLPLARTVGPSADWISASATMLRVQDAWVRCPLGPDLRLSLTMVFEDGACRVRALRLRGISVASHLLEGRADVRLPRTSAPWLPRMGLLGRQLGRGQALSTAQADRELGVRLAAFQSGAGVIRCVPEFTRDAWFASGRLSNRPFDVLVEGRSLDAYPDRDRSSSWRLSVVACPDPETMRRGDDARGWLVSTEVMLQPADVLALWDDAVAVPLLRALRTTGDLHAATVVPFFHDLDGDPVNPGAPRPLDSRASRWRLRYRAAEQMRAGESQPGDALGSAGSWLLSNPVVEPLEPMDVSVELNGLQTIRRSAVATEARLAPLEERERRRPDERDGTSTWLSTSLWPGAGERASGDDELFGGEVAGPAGGFAMSITELRRRETRNDVPRQVVRVGSIEFELPGWRDRDGDLVRTADVDLAASEGVLLAQVQPGIGRGATAPTPQPWVETQLFLTVRRAGPSGAGAIDVALAGHGDAVLLDVDRDAADSFTSQLQCRERLFAERAHDLSVDWRAVGLDEGGVSEPTTRRLIYLSTHPFFVACLPTRFGLTTDVATSVQIARLTREGGAPVWRFRGLERFPLLLPPQAVGEPMINPDWSAPPDWRSEDSGYPRVQSDGRNRPRLQPGFSRFAPPMRLDARTSRQSREYGRAPWNLAPLLGRASEEEPGLIVDSMRFELLYGLTCRVRRPSLRVAEIRAIIGEVPRPDPLGARQDVTSDALRDVARGYADRWKALDDVHRSRLGMLQVRDEQAAGEVRLSRDVDFNIRSANKALVRDPHSPETDPKRLPGGVTWGISSPNVYEEIARAPRAVGGELARPAFSALGGWGAQKAVFARGKSKILSDTTMGRVGVYSLERLGRIGVFWHLAKHVIVYERTASPSAQFPETGLLGVPAVRKVREFVEVLEPVRRYPEFGAPPSWRGFVRGCRFQTRVIPVDSRWGADIKDGWTVPLWQSDADQDVYPMPQVSLELLAGRRAEIVACEIEDPQKLVFYTSTDDTTGADTDAWPPVVGVDWPDTPAPVAPPPGGGDALDASTPDGMLPDADVHAEGHKTFTFAVRSAGRAVNLGVERVAEPMQAIVHNVTMARSVAAPNDRRAGDRHLRLLRAFGNAPAAQGMTFNRERVAYYFSEARRNVDMTPCAAMVDRAGDDLKALGMRVPTRTLSERIEPTDLGDFDLNQLFPDFAGLKLEHLFDKVPFPDNLADAVQLSQGVDPQSKRAWVAAEVTLELGDLLLFQVGPISITVRRPTLSATIEIAVNSDGVVSRSVSGSMVADWVLTIAGMELVIFERTGLLFDESGVQFDMSPDRIKLPGLLAFIRDLFALTEAVPGGDDDGGGEGGPPMRVLFDGIMPVGVEANIQIPVPPTQGGVSGISNLEVGTRLTLVALPDFSIGVGFNLSSPDSPFNITVFMLGGAGYLEASATYLPVSREFEAQVEIGIFASSTLAFAIGPIKGSISAFLGLSAEYTHASGGNSLALEARLVLRGEVSLAGLVTVTLCVILSLRYVIEQPTNYLLAHGSISVSVKICWCFTITFSASVEFRFEAGSSKPEVGREYARTLE